MAQKRGGNVQEFVQSRNPHPSGQPSANAAIVNKSASMDDLKMPGGGKSRRISASNNQGSRGQNRPATRAAAAQGHQQPFYGTDADSIDRTSTGSTKRANSTKRQAQQQVAQAPVEQREHEGSRSPREGSSDGMPVDPMQHPQQMQHYGTNGHDDRGPAAPHEYAQGIVQQHIKGDSYPPTTEGELSLPDQQEEVPQYSPQPSAGTLPAQVGVRNGLPNRGAGTRVPAQPRGVATQQARQNQPPIAQSSEVPFQPHFVVGDAVKEITNGFSFGVGPARQPGPAAAPHQKPPTQQQSVATNAAQPGSAPAQGQLQQNVQRRPLTQHPRSNGTPEAQQYHKQAESHLRRKSGQHDQSQYPQQRLVQQNSAQQTQQSQMTSRTVGHEDLPINNGRIHQQQRQVTYDADDGQAEEDDDDDSEEEDAEEKEAEKEPDQDPEPEPQYPPHLDYVPEDVFKMDYAALKSQSFDVDPNAEAFRLHDHQQHDTLQQKLETVSVLAPEQQRDFFASLTIDQWEDAGDWFLDRFREVSKKFKAARQDKRKAARAFEDQIEHRHEAVSRKRKLTEDALSEMKKSGAVVLQKSTPKKSKGTKWMINK